MRFALAAGLAAALAVGVAAAAGNSSPGVPHGFRPETAAAVGTRNYWVLGEYRCGSEWCNALVRSTDAGKHFRRVALPPFSSQGTIPTFEFANARDGFAYARYASRLYVTHDGGSSWHRSGPTGRCDRLGPERRRCLRRHEPPDLRTIAGDEGCVASAPLSDVQARLFGQPRSPRLSGLAARNAETPACGRQRRARLVARSRRRLRGAARALSCRARGKAGAGKRSSCLGRLSDGDDGRALAFEERRTFVPLDPLRPRSGRASPAVADERCRDRAFYRTNRRSVRRGRRAAAAYDRRGSALAARPSAGADLPARLARYHSAPLRPRRRPDTIVARRGRALAHDRRRRHLAFRADSPVKRCDEPPERGRVNRGVRAMISA